MKQWLWVVLAVGVAGANLACGGGEGGGGGGCTQAQKDAARARCERCLDSCSSCSDPGAACVSSCRPCDQ